MLNSPVIPMLLAVGIGLFPLGAKAHCDSIDGPVADAALRALDAGNVNLVLPYAPAGAEPEISAAFKEAVVVRAKGADARSLADRYFTETAVRLHRLGEGACYEGLKPAGTNFGPAIPAAETAVQSGSLNAVTEVLDEAVQHGLRERFSHVLDLKDLPIAPSDHEGVAAARQRVKGELEFITYVQGIYAATLGAAHAE
jgi:uncharacterized protein DUF6448